MVSVQWPAGRGWRALRILVTLLFAGALTWWIAGRADHPVASWRVVAAMVFVALLLLGWEALDPWVRHHLLPQRSGLYAVLSAAGYFITVVVYFALLGVTRELMPYLVGSTIGHLIGSRRRRERVEENPPGLWDMKDGRRWRTGSP